jgi:hypothetical protein
MRAIEGETGRGGQDKRGANKDDAGSLCES